MDPKEIACGDKHCLDEIDQNGFSDGLLLNTKADFRITLNSQGTPVACS
jgi:hypothetical protein